jgi:hypothetical protein
MPPRRADLLFDQVEIIEQPFRGGRDAAACRDGDRELVADVGQDAFVSASRPSKRSAARSDANRCVLASFLPCCSI